MRTRGDPMVNICRLSANCEYGFHWLLTKTEKVFEVRLQLTKMISLCADY